MISKPSSSFGKYLLKMPGNLVIQISNFSPVWADMIDSSLASPGGALRTAPWTFHPDKESIQTRISLQQSTTTVSAFLIPPRLLLKGNLASRERRQHTSQGNHAASSPHRKTVGGQEAAETTRTDVVNSLSRSASSELVRWDAAVPRPVNPKPGPTQHTPVAHWPLSSPEGARGTPESPTCSRRMENTYPGDDQRLVEVYAPRKSEAPGRRPGQDHVLGHGASWHGLARAGPQRVSPSGTAHSTPGAVSSLDRDPGALSPLPCDVTGFPSSPPPPTKESSNFGRKRRARSAGVYRRTGSGAASQTSWA